MSDALSNQSPLNQGMIVRHRTFIVVGSHAGLFACALLAAFFLAYNFVNFDRWFFQLYVPLLVLALPIKLLVFRWTGQYHGSWRYVGLRDLFGVISASLVATFLFLTIYFAIENTWASQFDYALIDRAVFSDLVSPSGGALRLRQSSVFALDWAITIAFVAASRILVRFYYEDIQPRRSEKARRILIVGAGDTGEAALRELLRTRRENYVCVGILDDDVAYLHGRIHGVEVLGRTDDIRKYCEELDVEEVLIALPHAGPKFIRSLLARCEGTGVLLRTIPDVTDLIKGRVEVSRIRNVEIGDLLGRDPVELDKEIIGAQLRDRCVLVTGAGGSIGSEMCRQIAAYSPRRLILLERAENALFEIDQELGRTKLAFDVIPYVADISDQARLANIFERERPSIVIHAAAHKHVPMMEINPGEAVMNNIGGTAAVANASVAAGVEKMVMISTDKAVNPTSIMGCTKRVAELYVQTLAKDGLTQFVTVRFGNVLGSSGSVVPIFRRQIAEGGPLTVTHPEMTRYFMTIPEAAQLVLQAGAMGRGGEIYVLHMGEPVKIVDLARDMITLSGLRPGIDVEISFSGIRPGEKLYEELSTEGEHIGDTAHPKIGIWKHVAADYAAIRKGVSLLMEIADTATDREVREHLGRLVPEYRPVAGSPQNQDEVPVASPK